MTRPKPNVIPRSQMRGGRRNANRTIRSPSTNRSDHSSSASRSDSEQGQGQVSDGPLDPAFEDVKRAFYAAMTEVHKCNGWGHQVIDPVTYEESVDPICEMITGAESYQVCHLIQDSNAMASRIIQFKLMDGIFEKLPSQVSKDAFEKYLTKLNKAKVSRQNLFLGGAYFHKNLESSVRLMFMMPTKFATLRLIKIAEDAALDTENSMQPFPVGFNSTKWIPVEAWMDPTKGVWESADWTDEMKTQKRFSIENFNQKGDRDDIALYELQIEFFIKMGVPSTNYKTVIVDGREVVEEISVPIHQVGRHDFAPPYKHTPPINSFLLPLEPVYVIVMFIFSFQQRQRDHPEEAQNDGMAEILDILALCKYFIRLVTSDYPSQFRDPGLDFGRPHHLIPFADPKDQGISALLWNRNLRDIYLNPRIPFPQHLENVVREGKLPEQPLPRKGWSTCLYSEDDEKVLDLMDGYRPKDPISDRMASILFQSRESVLVKKGQDRFEALRRLGLRYQDAFENHIHDKKVTINEAKFWLLTSNELDELDERVEYLTEQHEAIKEMMIYRGFPQELVHSIDPGMSEELSNLSTRPA